MLLIRCLTGKKPINLASDVNRTPSQLPINLASDVWMVVATCSPQACNMLVTSSQHVQYVGGGGRGAQHGKSVRNMGKVVHNMEKVFAT
jgi:hypothetical protein